jgi:cell division septation protein DedD
MRLTGLAVVAVFLLPALARANDEHTQEHRAMEMGVGSPNDAPIKITINPEARVSVALAGELPPPAPCGIATDLPVRIVNQGFVTAQLEAELVDNAPAGVTLDFHPAPLKGLPEESRALRIVLSQPGPTDLTIAFKAHNEIADLGGRDRVHFLMSCVPVR